MSEPRLYWLSTRGQVSRADWRLFEDARFGTMVSERRCKQRNTNRHRETSSATKPPPHCPALMSRRSCRRRDRPQTAAKRCLSLASPRRGGADVRWGGAIGDVQASFTQSAGEGRLNAASRLGDSSMGRGRPGESPMSVLF